MAADSHTADALREILATCADPLNRACEEYAKLARELAEANERLSQAMRNHGEQLMALHAQRSETRRTAAALHACEGLDTVDLEANEKGWLCGLAHDAARVERDLNNAFRARCVGNTMDDDPVCCQSYEAHEQAQPCPPGCCVMADQKDVRAVLEAIEREDKPEASASCNLEGPAHLCPKPAPGFELDHRGVLVATDRGPSAPCVAPAPIPTEDVLWEIRQELAALVSDPNNPDWMPALKNGNPADAECLNRAYELTGRGSESSAPCVAAPPTEKEIATYRDTFRRELDKRMDTKHPSASPSTESHAVALCQFIENRNHERNGE